MLINTKKMQESPKNKKPRKCKKLEIQKAKNGQEMQRKITRRKISKD